MSLRSRATGKIGVEFSVSPEEALWTDPLIPTFRGEEIPNDPLLLGPLKQWRCRRIFSSRGQHYLCYRRCRKSGQYTDAPAHKYFTRYWTFSQTQNIEVMLELLFILTDAAYELLLVREINETQQDPPADLENKDVSSIIQICRRKPLKSSISSSYPAPSNVLQSWKCLHEVFLRQNVTTNRIFHQYN